MILFKKGPEIVRDGMLDCKEGLNVIFLWSVALVTHFGWLVLGSIEDYFF